MPAERGAQARAPCPQAPSARWLASSLVEAREASRLLAIGFGACAGPEAIVVLAMPSVTICDISHTNTPGLVRQFIAGDQSRPYSRVRSAYARHRQGGLDVFEDLGHERLWPTVDFVRDWLKEERRRIVAQVQWSFVWPCWRPFSPD